MNEFKNMIIKKIKKLNAKSLLNNDLYYKSKYNYNYFYLMKIDNDILNKILLDDQFINFSNFKSYLEKNELLNAVKKDSELFLILKDIKNKDFIKHANNLNELLIFLGIDQNYHSIFKDKLKFNNLFSLFRTLKNELILYGEINSLNELKQCVFYYILINSENL